MYAIIATGGKQYKVSEGDVIKVEKLDAEAGNVVTFDQVIAVKDNDLKVGEAVANATVTARKLSFTNIREKQVTTRKMVIDKHTLQLKLPRSTLN